MRRRATKSGITGLVPPLRARTYCGRPEGASDTGSHDFDHEFRHRVRWLRSPRSDGNGGFGHRSRAHVPSGHFAAPRIVAEAAAELANPAHARTRQRSSLTLPTAALGNPDHAISSTARTVRISRRTRLPATGSTLSERSHPSTQPANATPASVWQDQVPMPANRSSRSPLARRITPSRQPLAPFALAGKMRLPPTGSTLNERSHPSTPPANATHASVWRDQAPTPATRSSQSRLATLTTPSRQRSHGLALGEGMRRTLPQRPKPLSDRCVPRVRRRSPQARREHGRRQTPRAGGTRANR